MHARALLDLLQRQLFRTMITACVACTSLLSTYGDVLANASWTFSSAEQNQNEYCQVNSGSWLAIRGYSDGSFLVGLMNLSEASPATLLKIQNSDDQTVILQLDDQLTYSTRAQYEPQTGIVSMNVNWPFFMEQMSRSTNIYLVVTSDAARIANPKSIDFDMSLSLLGSGKAISSLLKCFNK